MRVLATRLCWILLLLGAGTLYGQGFKLFDRNVQVHGFATQGFVHTNQNNWLTMETSNVGSGQFSDFGANISMPVTDKLRIGAQLYDRNLGQLGKWHPSLDWAYVQYRFRPWLSIGGGKVKTVMGLYNDTQDLDFLHTFVLLPQSVYPIDTRDATLAHTGGDIFGDLRLGKKLGTLSYTAYAGRRDDSQYGSIAYLSRAAGMTLDSYGGLQYGGDLRWITPLKGLTVGVSRMNQDMAVTYSMKVAGQTLRVTMKDNSDWVNQYYGQYSWKKLAFDAEYRRSFTDMGVKGAAETQEDKRGWYVGGSYQIAKRVQLGSYYSRFWIGVPMVTGYANVYASSGHTYDKVVTGRVELNKYMNVKVEGHFMDGYGIPEVNPSGFYLLNNLQGLKPETNALVAKLGFNF